MILHIIEPTLKDKTGHRFSFVHDVLVANSDKQRKTHLWLSMGASTLFPGFDNIVERNYFYRRIRQLQKISLYRKLLQKGETVFISTATSLDLILVSLLLRFTGRSDEKIDSVKFYVHWLYRSSKKVKRLKKVALRYPRLAIACPTDSVKKLLEEIGFQNVSLIPYPSAQVKVKTPAVETNPAFQKLLYAGAARADKGFPFIVEIIERLKAEKSDIPITLQCSTTHKGRHSEQVEQAIQNLDKINYPHLSRIDRTLDEESYRQLFTNSIVVQPYDANLFADRISGVLLDALKAGSPSVVPADTWMARTVETYGAGIVVEQVDNVDAWLAAIKEIIERWPSYAKHAEHAAKGIQRRHSPDQLIEWLYN